MVDEKPQEPSQSSLPICTLCDPAKVFASPRGLASHMKRHRDAVRCPLCGEPVRYLAPHLRSRHDVTDTSGDDLVERVAALVEENRNLRAENSRLRAGEGSG